MASKFMSNKKVLEDLKESKDLVFVSGCFDVIHYGHVQFLRNAKAQGKKLLVVVHDDISIKEKKGEDRPINPLGYRMEVLKEMESVDYITSWHGWENVSEFVKELKPGIMAVTEGAYEQKTVKAVADEIGSKLVPIKFVKEVSSSNILNKLGL